MRSITPTIVNDVHSRLNRTEVTAIEPVGSAAALRHVLHQARRSGVPLSVSGGRHAMGGQQFASGATLLDTRPLRRVLAFDPGRGLVEAEAGITWPALVGWLHRAQRSAASGGPVWTIAQKQTGADDFTLGGSVSANCHGRGLDRPPIVADVEALRVMRPDGEVVTCSRAVNSDLFRLVVGGYGLVGVIYSVVLRLMRRDMLQRVVQLADAGDVVDLLHDRIASGYTYGDFQFAVDAASPDFLRRGVLSCYRPIEHRTSVPQRRHELSAADWQRLLLLAHVDKARAFQEYSTHYLATSGQCYWSDEAQLGRYVDGYHDLVDQRLGLPGSEMISELYVPRHRLADFLAAAATVLRRRGADVIYGTVRLIRRDEETVLAWARQDYACVVLNLHVRHCAAGVARASTAFRDLIDLARERQGSYYLTYHRWATREQLLACHPRLPEFVAAKRRTDPHDLLVSTWWRALSEMLPEGREALALARTGGST